MTAAIFIIMLTGAVTMHNIEKPVIITPSCDHIISAVKTGTTERVYQTAIAEYLRCLKGN